MRPILTRLIADAALVGAILFATAGTLAWTNAWVLLAVLLFVRIVGARAVYGINPDLLHDRAKLPLHADQPPSDRILLIGVLATGMLGIPAVAGLDVGHWHTFPRPGPLMKALGIVLFSMGWTIKSLALRANAFAVPVVRAQREQQLVDWGVYAVVRHPFYAADPLIYFGIGLWLGSYLSVLVAVVPLTFMVARITHEEGFLRRVLPGYDAYIARVPYRLVPGVW
jgi:protein-S-isoprenylcysteine O-methyltransferase Ste14